MCKVITAKQAADMIDDNAVVAAATVGLNGWPQEIANAIGEQFLETGHPQNITLMHSCTCGDHKDNRNGTNALAYEGLVKRLICAHTGSAIHMSKLVSESKAECYLLPQGVICQLYRSIVGRKPGHITKVGMHTFADPRIEGGKVNDITTEDIVELMEIDGEEWLRYKNVPVDVALLRGTCCDERGNMTMDEDIAFMEMLSLAGAAKVNGGIVIAQVKYIASANSIHPKRVKIPGALVDYIVVTSSPELHMQTQQTVYNPAYAGDLTVPIHRLPPLPLDERKIIARRCAMELRKGYIINLGIGMPGGIAAVAAEEGLSDEITVTTETGVYGGVPTGGLLEFGAVYNPEAFIEHPSMFDLYDGGWLDIAFLGMAQADKNGNINVSKLGDRLNGPGGFINLTQNTRNVVFCGTFSSKAKLAFDNGRIVILEEGAKNKFVNEVLQITFSGKYAAQTNQNVLVVTERCVFRIENQTLKLIEIAPGIDLERDILQHISFKPEIPDTLKTMPSEIFCKTWGRMADTFCNYE